MNCVFYLDGEVRMNGVKKYIGGHQKARVFPNSVNFADIRKTADELWRPDEASASLLVFLDCWECVLEDDEDVKAVLSYCSRNPNALVPVWMVSQSVEKKKKKKKKNDRKSNKGKAAVDNFETTQPDPAESQSLVTPSAIIKNPRKGLTPLGSFIGSSFVVNGERVGRSSPVRPMRVSDDEVYRPECSSLPTSPTLPTVQIDQHTDLAGADFINAASSDFEESWVLNSQTRRSLDYGYAVSDSVFEQGQCSQPPQDGYDSYNDSAPPGALPRQSSIPNVPEDRSTHEDGDDSHLESTPPRAPRASSPPGAVPRGPRQKRKLPQEGSGRRKKKQRGAEDCGSKKRSPGHSRWEEENLESDDGIEANYRDALRPEFINFKKGQQFKDKEAFIFAYTTYAWYRSFTVKNYLSSHDKIIVICKGSGNEKCCWRLYARKMSQGLDVFTLVTITEEHSCCKTSELPLHDPQVNAQWIATVIEPYVMSMPRYPAWAIALHLRVAYGLEITYKQAWNAKESVLKKVRGSFDSSYQKLLSYCGELHKVDPQSVRIFHLDDDNVFQRFFWAYGEAVRTYRKYLRRVIVIDATFLTGRSYGTLFTACAMDADSHILPIGFAIAQGESEDNWCFFLDNLKKHVLVTDEPVVIMSDRHRSIITTVAKLFPHCLHSFCAQHIKGNLASAGRGMGDLFLKLSNTRTEQKFNTILEEIREKNSSAQARINRIGNIHWSEYTILLAGWRRYGINTSNHVESWHKLISVDRSEPIHVLLQNIRTRCSVRYKTYGDKARLLKGTVSETTQWKLNHNADRGRNYKVIPCSDLLFEVTTPKHTHVVDLEASVCSCNSWQVFGIPCSHAIKCMALKGLDPKLSCDPCYSRETLVATYQEIWRPTLDQTQWVHNPTGEHIGTPPKKKKAGRPPVKRWRRMKQGKPVQRRTCSRCSLTNHNIRTCGDGNPREDNSDF